ncbi:MAG: hypothetical protein MAG458_00453 [Nitrosopumilus sp.]|nr:hypothetical protein [Nitrosopumilus sp.]
MSKSESVFSPFGIYEVKDTLCLSLPNTEIKIERMGDNAFSYFRKDSEGNIVEKMIPSKSNELELEMAPIKPLNHPAKRTENIFLKFDKEIYLSENSAASIFVHCPIEIGFFLIHDSKRDPLDWVTCNPINSRFGLYGTPDTGTLCKYAEVSLATDFDDSIPYVEGVMKIIIENTLNVGHTVSKVVFPIVNNSLYYEDSKTIIDGIKVIMKKRAMVSIADIKINSLETNWTKSPTWETSTTNTNMEMGID